MCYGQTYPVFYLYVSRYQPIGTQLFRTQPFGTQPIGTQPHVVPFLLVPIGRVPNGWVPIGWVPNYSPDDEIWYKSEEIDGYFTLENKFTKKYLTVTSSGLAIEGEQVNV